MKYTCVAFLPLSALLAIAPAFASDSLVDAVKDGKWSLDARLRAENVDDDGIARSAEALTLRNRLGFRTAPWQAISLFVELENVVALNDHYNSTANGSTRYPTVADPAGTEWNQAALSWAGSEGTQVVVGRQRINLDNQRFIGNVGWRQNEQTFDAFNIAQTIGSKTTVRYIYLQDVHRPFGNYNPNPLLAEYDLGGHIAQASYVSQYGTVTGYAHFIENEDLPLTSQRTVGARFAGSAKLSETWKMLYTAEYATQSDWKDGSALIDADYRLLEFGVSYDAYTCKLAQEVLGGDGRYAFQTPFATLHAFNGWADRFLTTPVNGLVDQYLVVNGPVGSLQWAAAYHQFDPDHGPGSYGDEWDFSLSKIFAQRFTALAKVARYDSDGFGRDVNKFWLSLEYRY